MTLVVGWVSEQGAFLCADSAVTHGRPVQPALERTSLGEVNAAEYGTIEGALKIRQVHEGIGVALTGDVERCHAFVDIISDQVRKGRPESLQQYIADLAPVYRDDRRAFSVLFAHEIEGEPALTFFGTSKGVRAVRPREDEHWMFISGSLSNDWKILIRSVVWAVRELARRQRLDAEESLVVGLGALQTLGVNEYLMEQGVGGTYLGACVSGGWMSWQPGINYIIHPKDFFAELNPGGDNEDVGFTKVRTFFRDGTACVRSTVHGKLNLLFHPPGRTNENFDWARSAEASEWDNVVEIDRAWVFLSIGQRVVLVVFKHPTKSVLRPEKIGDAIKLNMDTQFVPLLTGVPGSRWVLRVLKETGAVSECSSAVMKPG